LFCPKRTRTGSIGFISINGFQAAQLKAFVPIYICWIYKLGMEKKLSIEIIKKKRRRMSSPCCSDCGQVTHPYMVTDELWTKISNGVPLLCIPCFELRLCRPLREGDLISDIGINAWMIWNDGHLEMCDAQTAWTLLKIGANKYGWKGLNFDRIYQAAIERFGDLRNAPLQSQ
jgi:hypothetical protein